MRYLYISLFLSVYALNSNAQIITTVAGIIGDTIPGYSGDGGQATNAELANGSAIAFDTTGNMFIVDEFNNRIRKVNSAGIITTIAGTGTQGFSGDGGQATAAKLNYPYGLAFDGAGNLFIADASNYCVRMINSLGIITTIAGNGTQSSSGDGGQATAAGVFPDCLYFDAAGNLFIAEPFNNRIRKLTTAGIISTVAGNGTSGYLGDGGQATAAEISMATGGGITIDMVGNLYIADYYNSRIRKVNTAGIISTIVGSNTSGYNGDGGQATIAELGRPTAVAFDAAGNLYISDVGNQHIRQVNTSGIISTIAGNGIVGFSGDGGNAINAEINYPSGVTVDAMGNLYIADYGNNVIRKVTSINNTTSISQISSFNTNISIYPNPNNGSFVIESQNPAKAGQCTVYDVNGNAVLSQTILGKTAVDASSLSEGVYTISLISNESIINKKLVIVR